MNQAKRESISYLLRLWRVDSGAKEVWRASLENTLTGERKGFADIEALTQYLKSLNGETKLRERKREATLRQL